MVLAELMRCISFITWNQSQIVKSFHRVVRLVFFLNVLPRFSPLSCFVEKNIWPSFTIQLNDNLFVEVHLRGSLLLLNHHIPRLTLWIFLSNMTVWLLRQRELCQSRHKILCVKHSFHRSSNHVKICMKYVMEGRLLLWGNFSPE